jgi:hypothetical protein
VHVDPVAMLVRSVASGLPASLVTSAKAPPPSGSSPAGSRTLHPDGRSKANCPSAVVKVFQAAFVALVEGVAVTVEVAGGEVRVGAGAADVPGAVAVAVVVVVEVGGAACGPHPATMAPTRINAGNSPLDLIISNLQGHKNWFLKCGTAGSFRTWSGLIGAEPLRRITKEL